MARTRKRRGKKKPNDEGQRGHGSKEKQNSNLAAPGKRKNVPAPAVKEDAEVKKTAGGNSSSTKAESKDENDKAREDTKAERIDESDEAEEDNEAESKDEKAKADIKPESEAETT